MTKKSLFDAVAIVPCCDVRSIFLVVCIVALFASGTAIAADAGSPDAAIAVVRSFLGREFTLNDPPTLTPDDKAVILAKQGKRACSVTLVRRASVLSGWKISAQDCQPQARKRAQHD